jgi:5-deoxy-glucuronate isomerase
VAAGTTASSATLHRRAGSTAAGGWSVVVTPESAGWGFSGLRVGTLAAGAAIELATGDDEAIVLPLAGGFRVTCGGETIELAGRRDPFSEPSDFAYLPRDSGATIATAGGGRVAVATARTERRLPFRHGPADGVPVELRGAGPSSRLVRNFGTPGAFEADRLIAVEVITPGGNWSSYPPHKHDEAGPAETDLEEIYYYEVASGPDGATGIGYQRVYGTANRPIDLLVEVRDGDVVLIPHGWHGPAMAAPGYDLYYLNVMAGPGDERAWRVAFDPAHDWVRDTWREAAVDERIAGLARPGRPA